MEDGFKKNFLKKKKFPLDKSHKICYNKIENKKGIKNLPKNFLKKFLKGIDKLKKVWYNKYKIKISHKK